MPRPIFGGCLFLKNERVDMPQAKEIICHMKRTWIVS